MATFSMNIHALVQLLIGFYFAFYGFWNIYHWFPILESMAQKKIPHPYLFLSVGIAWQSTAGILIMCGIFVKFAALSLLPFMIIAVFIFHPFWMYQGEHRHVHLAVFLANLTIGVSALLLLIFPGCIR